MSSRSGLEAESIPAPRHYCKLGTRLLLATLAVLTVGHTLSSVHTLWSEQHALAEQLDLRGQSIAKQGTAACVEAVLVNDGPKLQTFVDELIFGDETIVFARVERADGVVLAECLDRHFVDIDEERVKRFSAPIHVPGDEHGRVIGYVRLGLSTGVLDELESKRSRELIVFSSISFLAVAAVLAFLLRLFVARPISHLDARARALGQGDLDTPIVLETNDEFGRLAWMMDEMRQGLRDSYNELRERNEELHRVGAIRDQALADLELALAHAREASRVKSEFLATMSHEIRTPMNGVIGNTSLLLGAELAPEQREFAEAIRRSAESLRLIVDDILDFSSLETGRIVMQASDVELEVVLEDASANARELAASKGLEYHQFIDTDVPRRLRTDSHRLCQVLGHLLDNAAKFTPEGSVMLKISVDGRERDRTRLRFAVIDTGVGIAADQRKRIFEPFTQVDGSTARKHDGTGLGLAICQRLVRLLGGDIGCESGAGSGSLFWFTVLVEDVIPCTAQPAAPLPQQPTAGQEPSTLTAQPGTGEHVLVVEDNPVNQRMARHMLQRSGYSVDIAAHGAEGVSMAASTRYAVVLMDISMPVMDGYEATRRIREHELETGEHVPIVALTANAMPRDRERCLESGMDDYLAKPVTMEQLASKVEAWKRDGAALSTSHESPNGHHERAPDAQSEEHGA